MVFALLSQNIDNETIVFATNECEATITGSSDECGFIGRLCFELDLRWVTRGAFSNDGMAKGQSNHKLLIGSLLFHSRFSAQVVNIVRSNKCQIVIPQVGVVMHLANSLEHPHTVARNLFAGLGTLNFDVDTLSPLHACLGLCVRFSIGNSVNGCLLELHDVLGECTRLVRKDVFDLAHVI